MDLTKTTEPKSDQQNFDDYVAGPKTVTVHEVKSGTPDQPVEIHLDEFPGRPFKPSKSMRRVLVYAWGPDSSVYVGRRLTLFGDPTVKFGGQAVGGIRISHLSHIPGTLTVALTVTRGKREPFIVQPLDDPAEYRDALANAGTLEDLHAAWSAIQKAGISANPSLVRMKNDRKTQLEASNTDGAAE